MKGAGGRSLGSSGRPGPHAVLLLLLYLGLALAPLGLASLLDLPRRSPRDDIASGLASVGLAMLLMEFVLSGRFRLVSDRIGIDRTMRFHQLISWSLLAFILLHPLLYQTSLARPAGAGGSTGLGLNGMSLLSGGIAYLLLPALVLAAIFRDRSGETYEGWRLVHLAGAIIVAVLGVHHTLLAGHYAAHPVITGYWLLLLGLALFSVAWVHLIMPLRMRRHPYHVRSVQPVALRTWDVTVEPASGQALDFAAGQFVWLTLGRSPFSLREHPFSISSAPARRPAITFTIKEAGDFTNTIGDLRPGTVAYIDGPHGNFTLEGREASGIGLIAGGVGMAPIMSILRQLLAEQSRLPIVLVYGNRLEEQILYRAELEAMREVLNLEIVHVLGEPTESWKGETGQPDEAILRRYFSASDAADWLYFVCGPAGMIDMALDVLTRNGILYRRIVSERFRYD